VKRALKAILHKGLAANETLTCDAGVKIRMELVGKKERLVLLKTLGNPRRRSPKDLMGALHQED